MTVERHGADAVRRRRSAAYPTAAPTRLPLRSRLPGLGELLASIVIAIAMLAAPSPVDGAARPGRPVVDSNATACTLALTDSAAENRLLERVNRERRAAGLRAVELDRTFVGPIARWRSRDMIERRFFSHHVLPPDGPLFVDWLDRAGINYSLAGETIGWSTQPDQAAAESAIMDGFLASAAHRAIVLGSEYTDVAIGVAGSCSGPLRLASDEGTVGPVERVEIVTLIFVAQRGPNAPIITVSSTPPAPAVLRVTVTPDGPGELRVVVVDGRGRVVRWLTRGRHVAGRSAVGWNGLDANGRRVHGTFRVRAWTVDAHGRTSPVRSVGIRLA